MMEYLAHYRRQILQENHQAMSSHQACSPFHWFWQTYFSRFAEDLKLILKAKYLLWSNSRKNVVELSSRGETKATDD